MQEGQLVEGVVTAVRPDFAFMDIGHGVSGFLHKTQLSISPVPTLEGVLAVGETIKVGHGCAGAWATFGYI